jgi:hypothetical protein
MNCDTPIKCDPSGNCTDAQTRADISNWLIQKSNEAQSTPIDGTITAMCCTRTDDDTDLCDTTDYHCSKSDPMVFLPFRNGTWDNTADFYTPSGFSWKCISEDGTAQACLTDDNYNPNACLSSTTGEATTQAVNTHQWFGCRDDLMSPQFLPSGVKGNKDNIKLGHKYWGVQIKK